MRIITFIFCSLVAGGISGQGTLCPDGVANSMLAWIEPAKPDVTDSVTIYLDISQDPNCNKLVGNEEELYIWTWSPTEPVGGNGEWTDSNTDHSFKKVEGDLYSMTIIPTEFYGVDPAEIYDKGFCFLAKRIDGGSGGDCSEGGDENKTADIHVNVPPPDDVVRKVFSLPDRLEVDSLFSNANDVFTIFYDNNIEEKTTMQGVDNISMYLRVIGTDGKTYKYVSLNQIADTPELALNEYSQGKFRASFIPNKLLAGVLPDGISIKTLRIQLITVPLCGSECAVDGDFYFGFKCVE